MIKLGVNIDHVATLRQARRGKSPDPVEAAFLCELVGCDSIVCHLREDRRHIQERDLYLLKETVKTRLNLEMALVEEIIKIALKVKPSYVTLVPEKREELTTEGGLDIKTHVSRIKDKTADFKAAGIRVSLFIEPEFSQIEASRETGAEFVELHTGRYAESTGKDDFYHQLDRIIRAAEYALSLGLGVNAGHGLDYSNVGPICQIKGIEELNIGYSIIGRAVYVGIPQAVKEMLSLIRHYEKKDN